MRIPTDAPVSVQQAFRELWAALGRQGAGPLNTDVRGKRIINAGDALAAGDYVTLRQLRAALRAAQPIPDEPTAAATTPPSDGGAIPRPGTPPPSPPPTLPPATGTFSATDMLDLTTVTVENAPPDIATWPQTATLTVFDFQVTGVFVDFTTKTGAGRWPDYTPPGWTGPMQYTLWIFLHIGGVWYGTGAIQFYYGQDRNGGPPSQVAANWYYDPIRWPVMAGQQPTVGDSVGFMLSAGNARNETGVTSVKERTQTILVPFPSDSGAVYTT